jgi:hypothetical protein
VPVALVSAGVVGASGMADLVILRSSFSGLRSRHNPDIASIFRCDHSESPSSRRPAGLLIGQMSMKMQHCERFSNRTVRIWIQPLPPKTGVSIFP